MNSHKVLRAGIFILAFLVGLLRESIAQGQSTRADDAYLRIPLVQSSARTVSKV